MRFAYYQHLSRAEKRAYDESDQRRTVALTEPAALRGSLEQIEVGLAGDDRERVEQGTRALVDGLVLQTNAPPVTVRVLAVRPSDDDGELHGFYELDEQRRAQLRVWMRTAAKKKPVAFRSFVRTVLHELCHHLDFARDELDYSFHTAGFFARESDLARQLLGAPKRRVPAPPPLPSTQARTQPPERPRFLDAKLRQPRLFDDDG